MHVVSGRLWSPNAARATRPWHRAIRMANAGCPRALEEAKVRRQDRHAATLRTITFSFFPNPLRLSPGGPAAAPPSQSFSMCPALQFVPSRDAPCVLAPAPCARLSPISPRFVAPQGIAVRAVPTATRHGAPSCDDGGLAYGGRKPTCGAMFRREEELVAPWDYRLTTRRHDFMPS